MAKMDDIECVLLDIEGTICPISFVKDTLFPYALDALPEVLASEWEDEGFKPYKDAFPEAARSSPEALQSHVEDLTKRDVKVAYLKNLQGYLWENGYRTGAYSTPLFSDVVPQLKTWNDSGIGLAIYSSGSVFAQKLLFGHVKSAGNVNGQKRRRSFTGSGGGSDVVEPVAKKRAVEASNVNVVVSKRETVEPARGGSHPSSKNRDLAADNVPPEANSHEEVDSGVEDFQYLISDWFDTTNAGSKTERSSYEKIADVLKTAPNHIHFLSDAVKEVDASREAGMQSFLVVRPGNAPLSEEDSTRLGAVTSLHEIAIFPPRLVADNRSRDTSGNSSTDDSEAGARREVRDHDSE